MPIVRTGAFEAQADGTEVAVLVSATTLLARDPSASPPGLELRRLAARRTTWLFALPAATLVVHGIDDEITLRVRERDEAVRELGLRRGDSYVAPPGTILQLCNESDVPRVALLVTSPGRLRELEGKRVLHDDAVVVGRRWAEVSLDVAPQELAAQRAEALRRQAARRGQGRRRADPVCAPTPAPSTEGRRAQALVAGALATMEHLELAAGAATAAVRHRTVEQLWHVLSGRGELWRALAGEPRVEPLGPGDSVCLSPGVPFQVRAAEAPLRVVVTTAPGWPGAGEAVSVQGPWA
ncbi:MAG: cupin domain-containing protein [Kofleriaceae bacterium]